MAFEHKINTQTNKGFFTCKDCSFAKTCKRRSNNERFETVRCSEFDKA